MWLPQVVGCRWWCGPPASRSWMAGPTVCRLRVMGWPHCLRVAGVGSIVCGWPHCLRVSGVGPTGCGLWVAGRGVVHCFRVVGRVAAFAGCARCSGHTTTYFVGRRIGNPQTEGLTPAISDPRSANSATNIRHMQNTRPARGHWATTVLYFAAAVYTASILRASPQNRRGRGEPLASDIPKRACASGGWSKFCMDALARCLMAGWVSVRR